MIRKMNVLKKINIDEAKRYLGYKDNEVDEQTQKVIDTVGKELLCLIKPRYIYKCFDIKSSDDECITLQGCSVVLKGRAITRHLYSCHKCVLMCATIGDAADKYIRLCSSIDMTKAVVADSLCSAAIEQVCDMAEEEIHKALSEYYMTLRFSPGYGDLPLDIQSELLKVLDANKRIGLYVTDTFMMNPGKSVTAIIGISNNIIERKKQGCIGCSMNKTCNFRKRGEHCGN